MFEAEPRIGYVVMRHIAEVVGRRLLQVEALWARELQRAVTDSLAASHEQSGKRGTTQRCRQRCAAARRRIGVNGQHSEPQNRDDCGRRTRRANDENEEVHQGCGRFGDGLVADQRSCAGSATPRMPSSCTTRAATCATDRAARVMDRRARC